MKYKCLTCIHNKVCIRLISLGGVKVCEDYLPSTQVNAQVNAQDEEEENET